jgi:hypothetical protein
MTTGKEATLLARWRQRLHLTEGRLYSSIIVLVLVALLAPTLTHWKPVALLKPLTGETFAHHATAPSSPSTPPSSSPSAALAAPLTGGLPPISGTGSLSSGLLGSLPSTGSNLGLGGTLVVPPVTAPPQTVSPGPSCTAAALNATVTSELTQLNSLLKVLPTASLETAIGLATGCNDVNPALFAVGALTELGDDLSTAVDAIPGAAALTFPTIHAIELPASVVPILAALKPVFAPICGDINSASDVILLIAPHYPQVIDGATALALFQSAVTCAQLTGASP